MKKHIQISVLLILGICFTLNAAHPLIEINGKQYWLNGINMPWNSFGTDFGTHYQWGALHDSTLFDNTFKKYSENGINCVRIWIHCDGRSTPEFSAPGSEVTGLDANFFTDFDNMMAIAEKYEIFVMPALWSFDMSKVNTDAGQFAGVNTPLITDSAKTLSYINNVLIPLVQRYADHPYLFAWEICNEPEWIIETLHACDIKELQRFHAMLAAAIHENCTNYVTTGAASLKWNSNHADCVGGGGGHWWSDSALQATHNSNKAYLDIYQIHFYEWMIPWYVPYTKGVDYWQDIGDRPVIIGETPGHDVSNNQFTMTLVEMYEAAYDKEYAGVFAWSDRANDGHGTFDSIKIATNAFYSNHADIVNGLPTSIKQYLKVNPKGCLNFSIVYKNGKIVLLANNPLPVNEDIYITLYNMQGKKIFKSIRFLQKTQNSLALNCLFKQLLSNGIYILQIRLHDVEYTTLLPLDLYK